MIKFQVDVWSIFNPLPIDFQSNFCRFFDHFSIKFLSIFRSLFNQISVDLWSLFNQMSINFRSIRFLVDSWLIHNSFSINLRPSKLRKLIVSKYISSGVHGICNQSSGANEISRLCGSIFNVNRLLGDTQATVCDCSRPFTVRIKTNGVADAGIAAVQRGVS